jgi:hypothetical protein
MQHVTTPLSSAEPYEFLVKLRNITWETIYVIVSQNALGMMGRRKLGKASLGKARSALDHVELTYHDVIISKIPDVQVTGFKIFNYQFITGMAMTQGGQIRYY